MVSFRSSFFLFTVFSMQALAQSLTAVVDSSNGQLTFLDREGLALSFGYYDWGPNWSGVRRNTQVEARDKRVPFTFQNEIQQTKTRFEVTGAWEQTGANTFSFSALLTPGGSSALGLSQFSLTPGPRFHGEARVVSADGSRKPIRIPFERGTVGDAVRQVILRDGTGAETQLHFAQPTSISADGGQARIRLAADRIEPGQTPELAFTVTLPQAVRLIARAEDAPPSQDGWYPMPSGQPVPEDSVWSLASWLEAPAGKHGRIRAVGDDLVYNGNPIQLWGLNVSYNACAPEKALADSRADFYSAMGINAVRLHKYADGTGWAGILSERSAVDFKPDMLDRMDYFVSALKAKGIYVKLSPVFIMNIGPDDKDRIPYLEEFEAGNNGWRDPKHGSLYFSRELQDMLIEQLGNLLRHRNPHTGLTYAEDPAVAYVELYNEDSALFFGTPAVLASSKTLRERSGQMFSAWLRKKYGSEETFLAAWGAGALNSAPLRNFRIPTDESWAENRIYPVGNPWFFDPANLETTQAEFKTRMMDTMRFLYELQNEVYARMVAAIRAAGYEGEIIASNWHAGRQMSHFYNLHSDALVGTIDRHNYFGGGRPPLHANASMLDQPGGGMLSSSLNQVAGHPFMLSEWIHVLPNEWGAEGAALIASYGMGLQGWDVSFPFQNRDTGSFSPHLREIWDATAPNFIGMFPGLSRQVHRRDVKTADLVHHRNVHIPSLNEGRVGFDMQSRAEGDIKVDDTDVFPAEALAVARGLVRFTDTFQETEAFDLAPYRQDGELLSSTGQLRWRAGDKAHDGFFSLHSPATQALVGFAEGVSRDLGDVIVRPASRFAALHFTARSPTGTLATDEILVTAIARARNEGAVVVEDRFVMSPGTRQRNNFTGPVLMEPVRAQVHIKRPGATLHILTPMGQKTGRSVPVDADGSFLLDTGRDQTPYYLITFP
jgi:hypothetical protein